MTMRDFKVPRERMVEAQIARRGILDRRVLTKQYGRLFIESLPRWTARQGPAGSLAGQAAKWLGT